MFVRKCVLLAAIAVVSLLPLALLGCGGVFGSPTTSTSLVRVVNALVYPNGPNSGNLDVSLTYSNSAAALNEEGALGFGTIQPSGTGNYEFVQTATGVLVNAYQTGTTVSVAPQISVNLTQNVAYTIAVAGLVGQSVGTQGAPQIIQFSDTLPSIPPGSAALRLINLTPDSPAQGLSLYNTSGTPPTAAAITGLMGVTYGNASSTNGSNWAIVPAGTYTLSAYNGGNAITTKTSINPVTLTAGKAYTVFTIGQITPTAGGQAFDLRLAQDV